jgi:hypothetical protein
MGNMKERAEHAKLEKEGKLIAKGVPDKIEDDDEAPPTLEEVSDEQLKKE